jgi:AraC-like DNA-binding protein
MFRIFVGKLNYAMATIVTYNCDRLESPRLFIPNLSKYLQSDESFLHIIKGTLLCFCRQGSVKIKVNYNTYTLHANDILAILPTHVFCIEECSDDVTIEALLFSDEFWVSISHSVDYTLLKIVEQCPFYTLPEAYREEVATLLRLIRSHEEANDVPVKNMSLEQTITGGLAFSLLMLLVSLIDRAKAITPHPLTRKEMLTHDFFELLSQHYETERQVAFYASKLCVTPKHLSTMVKEVTRLPILEWINNVTVLNIKHKLLTSTDTIQQISEELNFQTPSTFVRYFRQHTGTTPSKYRNERHT